MIKYFYVQVCVSPVCKGTFDSEDYNLLGHAPFILVEIDRRFRNA
jgi:hypothetical protein